jgi:HD-GYP domain-containing protein (c-di-GMP phosphodiesterase class II)
VGAAYQEITGEKSSSSSPIPAEKSDPARITGAAAAIFESIMENRQEKPPLYSSRIIDAYIKLIKTKYSHVNIGELLRFAKMEPYEVADQGHWFTQEQINRFHDRAVKVTGNDRIAREAGRYTASPESMGVMRQYLLGFVSPTKAYQRFGKTMCNFTRSSLYESRVLAANRVEITVTPVKGVREKPFQCENRIGFMEAIADVFNNRSQHIDHPECMFRNSTVCRYVISWKKPASLSWRKMRDYGILLLFPLSGFSFMLEGKAGLLTVLPYSLSVLLAVSLLAARSERKELTGAIRNLRQSTDKLIEQINVNYNNALLTNEIGQAISKQTDIDALLSDLALVLKKRLDYDRGMILLADTEKKHLFFRSGFGYTEEQEKFLQKTAFHLTRPESKGVFVISFRNQKPFLVNDFDEIRTTLSMDSLAFAKKMGAQSFIVCPIVCDGHSIGVLAVDNVVSKKPLVQSNMSLLMGIATIIGISIRNTMLNEAKERQFKSTLQTLAASIDARDTMTAGHAEKVTEYSLGICRELGLSRDYSELIRVSSLLHDYGKIGIPDAVLKKEGPLTDDEYRQVQSHVEKTGEILAQINFEGIYRHVPEVAGSHHEKIDGSGYPRGLKGSEIPLGSKIIAVADFFEAITAKRHYREPMPLAVAKRLLKEKCGTHFDRKVVVAFFSYLEKSGEMLVEKDAALVSAREHRSRRVPCRMPVSFRVNGKAASGTGTDISTKGMYVAGEDDIEEGSAIELCFSLPDSRRLTIRAKGRVAWVNSGERRVKPVLPSGFGVEFLNVEPDRGSLRSFIGG